MEENKLMGWSQNFYSEYNSLKNDPKVCSSMGEMCKFFYRALPKGSASFGGQLVKYGPKKREELFRIEQLWVWEYSLTKRAEEELFRGEGHANIEMGKKSVRGHSQEEGMDG